MHQKFLFLFFVFLIPLTTTADIGETYELKSSRRVLVQKNEALLKNKSLEELDAKERKRYIQNLEQIKQLDEQIFESQQETIQRVQSGVNTETRYRQALVLLCFFMTLIALSSIYMVYLMHQRVKSELNLDSGFKSTLRQLLGGVLMVFSPQSGKQQKLVVNTLVIFGLLFMLVSFIGYFLTKLGI